MEDKPKLLLHTCCAPCSTHCINVLKEKYSVFLYFYDPNIHPYGEYIKRLESARKLADSWGIPLIEGDYDAENWLEAIAGYEEEPEGGKRCKICFMVRLENACAYAKKHGFEYVTTTMTVSPHKNAEMINHLGDSIAKFEGVNWVYSDFKKEDGFKKSTEISNELDLYRQNYCGCFYSVR